MHHTSTAGESSAAQTQLPISFTGSGSEYFRIWIVNLLLTFVTLGLYYPWAKVRKLRYFYGNTLVGEHALDFHGDPKKMLRGFLLVGVLLGLYSAAGHISPTAGTIALLIVACVWPALFRASMQFRLANTSWRGLRFHFNGSMAGAYKAMLPAFIPGLLFLALAQAIPEQPDAKVQAQMPAWFGAALGFTWLAAVLVLPALWWAIKRYQHDHYNYGQVQTQLRAGVGQFYGVFLKTFGVTLGLMIVVAFIGGILAVMLGVGGFSLMALGRPGAGKAMILLIILVGMVGYLGFIIISQSFFTSRMQNLLWNRTKSTRVRFESRLKLGPMLGLTIKNWLLTALTLGFYWPFAAVATARLKLQSVTVYTRVPPDQIVSRARLLSTDFSGEAAADLFGIDFGL